MPDDGSVVGAARVTVIESQIPALRELPDRVASLDVRVASLESQFLQFLAEVNDQFLATRNEIRAVDAGLRQEIQAVADGLREEIATSRQETTAGDEETRRYMRVLHEEVISRIKAIGET
ncbi:MAG: hypothetical protein A3G76_07055 [Acidobacteria bacterium RIFCSPLOWO2_12_FULL_65_11]|nr:MAG: hypothetical protein A3H95_01030 [Acidobacteria bacterium RIFCSPLOWO2_02_FULL_64_15]OFW31705.1 MAG: hypothetical protein A3G76_07055 [Acidobacteria bacterium RIFCSPLOWO2_12_FULL_65_11]